MTEEIEELLKKDNVEMIVKEYDENGNPKTFIIKEHIDPPIENANLLSNQDLEEE